MSTKEILIQLLVHMLAIERLLLKQRVDTFEALGGDRDDDRPDDEIDDAAFEAREAADEMARLSLLRMRLERTGNARVDG